MVLYDQYDNDSLNATSSQNFEADFDAFDDETADDFVVPSGDTWNVNQVDAAGQYFNGTGPMISANVSFYSDSSGLPGSQVATRPNLTVVDSGGSIVIAIPSAVVAHAPATTGSPSRRTWTSAWAASGASRIAPCSRTPKRPGRTQAAASVSARRGAAATARAGSTPVCPIRSSA